MSEGELAEKLRRIQALFTGATTEGERKAAAAARERIEARLRGVAPVPPAEPLIEHRFTLDNPWSRRLLVALLRRHGVEPYRTRGQRRTTVMARMTRRFCEEILWPEYVKLDATLHEYFDDLATRVIGQAVFPTATADAPEVGEPARA